MPHQVALTIRAPVKPGQADALRRRLASMADPATKQAIPFERLGTTHFARLFVLDEVDTGPDGGPPIPASLVYMSDVDAPAWRHLVALVRVGGPLFHDLFGHCEGWPSSSVSSWARVAWLRARRISSDVVYVNTVGRSVAQVHGERRLRQAIEEFLDGKQTEWGSRDPVQIHTAVRQFVASRPELRWALEPARGAPGLCFGSGRSSTKSVDRCWCCSSPPCSSPCCLSGPCCCAATSAATCPTSPSRQAANACASWPTSRTTWCRTRSPRSAGPSRAASGT
jgi:hypothetical protein